jgi:hypothetical protein
MVDYVKDFLPEVAPLFQKHISKHSISTYMALVRDVGRQSPGLSTCLHLNGSSGVSAAESGVGCFFRSHFSLHPRKLH